MTDVTLFVGSVYGGARETARAAARALTEEGLSSRLVENPTLEDLTADQSAILVCTSTTGQGELPANILPFYLAIRETLPVQPGRPFGVIVLGDQTYGDTFCGAGELMEEALYELGCRKIGDTLQIDACETFEPESAAPDWTCNWVRALRETR